MKYLKLILIAALLVSCGTTHKMVYKARSLEPFFRSLVLNQNVYKTKDTLELIRVYDDLLQSPIHDSTAYIIRQQKPGEFIRYNIVKDGDLPVVKLLSGVYKHQGYQLIGKNYNTINLNPVGGLFDSTKYYYQFNKKDINPAQKYLATEHITGIPLTIPVKFRFNVPADQSIFDLSASVAYSFGYRIRVNNNPNRENYVRLILMAAGLGSDTYLSRDSITNHVKNYKGETSVALTFASGATYEAGDKWNFGVFLGLDRMFGDKKDWYYQNKVWLGAGFGYKFGDSGK